MIDIDPVLRLALILGAVLVIPALWLVCWLLDRIDAWRARRVHRRRWLRLLRALRALRTVAETLSPTPVIRDYDGEPPADSVRCGRPDP